MSLHTGNSLGESLLCSVGSAWAGNFALTEKMLSLDRLSLGGAVPAGVWFGKSPRGNLGPGCLALQELYAVLMFSVLPLSTERLVLFYDGWKLTGCFSHSISIYTLCFLVSPLLLCSLQLCGTLIFPLWNLSSAWQSLAGSVSFIPCSMPGVQGGSRAGWAPQHPAGASLESAPGQGGQEDCWWGKPKCGCHCALPIIPAMRCRIPPGMHGRGSLLIHLGYKFRNITAKIYHTLDLLTKIVENGARQVLAVLQIILFCVVVLDDLYWSNRHWNKN